MKSTILTFIYFIFNDNFSSVTFYDALRIMHRKPCVRRHSWLYVGYNTNIVMEEHGKCYVNRCQNMQYLCRSLNPGSSEFKARTSHVNLDGSLKLLISCSLFSDVCSKRQRFAPSKRWVIGEEWIGKGMGFGVRDGLLFGYLSAKSGENYESFVTSVTPRVKSQTMKFALTSSTSEKKFLLQ
jgi:hypothetical protein